MRLARTCCLLLAMVVALAGCGGHASPGRSPSGDRAVATTLGGGAASARVTKLLVVVIENHSLQEMRTGMPYTFALARRFGYASDYHGVTYPSLPNYLAILGGSTDGVHDDDSPAVHPVPGPTVLGRAVAHGETAKAYVDGMPSTCALDNGGDHYAVKHNPWAYYPAERDLCRADDVPASRLSSAVAHGWLPDAGMVVPNMCHDAHDCPLSHADDYLRGVMQDVFTGPDWKSGHLAVVVTADTDDRKAGNQVLTVVVHPSQHGRVVGQRLDHYALSRLYSDVTHTAPVGLAAHAPSMARAFHLPIG